jgi:acetyl-CoA synthetase
VGRRASRQKHDLSSLRLLGSVGEGINPEAWMWYHRVIGGERCPIVDTWWQTETGGIMMSPLPGATPPSRAPARKPLPGIIPKIVDEDGDPSAAPTRAAGSPSPKPWPGMLRGIWGDNDALQGSPTGRRFPGYYVAGDNARRDATATTGSWAASTTC